MLADLLLNMQRVCNLLLMLQGQPHRGSVHRSVSQVVVDTTDGSTANTISAGTITSGVYSPGTIAATQDTAGNAFSFSQSYTQGDAVPTNQHLQLVLFLTSPQLLLGWNCRRFAGSVTGTTGAISITAGGAGTTATGQFVSEITVID